MTSAAQLEVFRADLTGLCYRMLGSVVDADDAVQETMVRAWKGLAGFDGRASLRTWLHRIATNVCLDAASARARRERPVDTRPPGDLDEVLVERPRDHWLEPVPDERVLPADVDPAERVALRQSIRLAFVAALQHLPPRQRAALILSEVLGHSAAEVADTLDASVASVNSALQRARATLAEREVRDARPLTEEQLALLDRYVAAFERYDVDELVGMLRDDASLSMPPLDFWLQGPSTIRAWLLGRGAGCRGSRIVRTEANGVPAFAQWKPGEGGGPHRAWALHVLELDGDRIASWVSFLDTETLFPRFGLPLELG